MIAVMRCMWGQQNRSRCSSLLLSFVLHTQTRLARCVGAPVVLSSCGRSCMATAAGGCMGCGTSLDPRRTALPGSWLAFRWTGRECMRGDMRAPCMSCFTMHMSPVQVMQWLLRQAMWWLRRPMCASRACPCRTGRRWCADWVLCFVKSGSCTCLQLTSVRMRAFCVQVAHALAWVGILPPVAKWPCGRLTWGLLCMLAHGVG